MSETALSIATMLFSLFSCTCPLLAQVRQPLSPARPGAAHVEPCWQQVGISKSAIEERAAVARETRSQVEAVCADTTLTPQQRQQRIREIRQQAKEKTEALISPQQQEALSACQKERAGNRPPAPGLHHGGTGTGPCGELTSPPAHPAGSTGHTNTEKPPAEEETSPQN